MCAEKAKLLDIVQATSDFENWAARHVDLVRSNVALKHQLMASSSFPFMRATFYRWAQWWPLVCPELARAPQVLAVGDLHVDNFGTWRDLEGRLIWGVNDFDEAWPAAYAVDLVRLVTSAYLAIQDEHLTLTRKQAFRTVEEGYRDSMAKGGAPFVLAEQHHWLRVIALNNLRDPVVFWKKILACPKYKGQLPKDVMKLVHNSMPVRTLHYEMRSRVAGLGSLGHPRVLSLATWDGAHIVREAKQLTPSAWIWARRLHDSRILGTSILLRTGLFAASLPIAHMSRFRPFRRRATKKSWPTAWAGRPPIFTLVAPELLPPLNATWPAAKGAGCIKLPRPCST